MNLGDASRIGGHLAYLAVASKTAPVHGERGIHFALTELKRCLDNEESLKDFVDEISGWIVKLEKYRSEKKERLATDEAKDLEEWAFLRLNQMTGILDDIPVVKVELQSGLNPHELKKVADKLPSEFISEETWENFLKAK